MQPRRLQWPNCLNVRELGGLPSADGTQLKSMALIRADNLTRLSPDGIGIVRQLRLGRIVDLRSPGQCEHDPSPFTGEPVHCHRPLSRPDDPWDPDATLAANYAAGLDRNPDLYTAAVEAVATAPPGGVVINCHAGKDRSGQVVAVILRLLGVPAPLIADDYAAVSDAVRDGFAADVAAVRNPAARARLAEELSSRPETMTGVLDHLDTRHGGVRSYLRRDGLTDRSVSRLRDRLITPIE